MVCRECFQQNLTFTDEPQCSICFGRITHVNGQPIAEYLNQNSGAAWRQAQETRWLNAIQKDARVMLNGRIDSGNIAFALQAIQKNPEVLEHLTAELQDNPEVVTPAVLKDASQFRHASQTLRSDVEYVDQLMDEILSDYQNRPRNDPYRHERLTRARNQCLLLVEHSQVQHHEEIADRINSLFE